MTELSPGQLQRFVELSLVLEPVADKEGCTTRHVDIPGKPLGDFLIAAVNVGEIFREYASSLLEGNQEVYSHLLRALAVSNDFKRKKYINHGLLVFLFIAVKSRHMSSSLDEAVKNMFRVIKESGSQDVRNYMKSWEVNLETSTQSYKAKETNDNRETFDSATSLFELFVAGTRVFKDPHTTLYQFCKEHVSGYPTVMRYCNGLRKSESTFISVQDTYAAVRADYPERSPGLLSDLAAAALFLYLSFQDSKTFTIT